MGWLLDMLDTTAGAWECLEGDAGIPPIIPVFNSRWIPQPTIRFRPECAERIRRVSCALDQSNAV